MDNNFELEKRVAKILGTQFWNGMQEKRGHIKAMQRAEYINNSLTNWIPAARGVITLVRRSIKNGNSSKSDGDIQG